jgi:hypothetical protein
METTKNPHEKPLKKISLLFCGKALVPVKDRGLGFKKKNRHSYIMYYVLLYYPKFDKKTEENVQAFRRKYDPFADSLKPHLPFIFPVPRGEVEETKLTGHVETVLKNWKPFPIHMEGFTKSWDHWLFLLLKEGNEEATALHDELYTGILSPYLRRDIKYIPHIGIGLFARKDAGYNALDPKKVDLDAKLYSQALREAESLKINSLDTVDRLFLDRIAVKAGASLYRNAPSKNTLIQTVSSKEIPIA